MSCARAGRATFGGARKLIAIGIQVRRLVLDVRLFDRAAVQDQLLIHQADAVARHSDDALDVVLADVFGVPEHHDVSALNLAVGQQAFARGAHR